jgi:hypothetical protein
MPKLKTVFADTPKDKIDDEIKAYKHVSPRGEDAQNAPKLPDAYNRLDGVDTSKSFSRQGLYTAITKFTPYLIKNLLYLSKSPNSSNRDKIQASKILLDKVMPNLEAQHVQMESDSLQSLVIVKSSKKK